MKIAVIGAGITGLTAAHRLAKAGHQVHVFEAARGAGGLASGFRDPGWDWHLERFYHHLFESDAAIRSLADEIGFGSKLFFRRPKTTQWWNGKTYAMDSPGAVMSFPGLPFGARVRFGMAVAYLKFFCKDWKALERMTACEWCERTLGKDGYELLMEPLLKGKFGPFYRDVNMAWLWARFKARTPRLGYFEGGFQAFVDALAGRIADMGGKISTASPVDRIERSGNGQWTVRTGDSGEDFDLVISTTSPHLLAHMVPDLPPGYLEGLSELKSMGAIVVTIALKNKLTDGAYWINVPKPEFPFLALVEHTNFIEPEHYGGAHLIYCGDYIEPGHEYFSLSPEEVLKRFLPSLKVVNPSFSEDWVIDYRVHREQYAQPIVTVNHSARVPAMATPLSGLYWASMSHIYPWDRGTNFSVGLGEDVAREVLQASPAPAGQPQPGIAV